MSSDGSDADIPKMETMEMGEGNTKPPPKRMNQSKRWTFTYNNYSVEQMEMMETVFKNRCSGYIFEEEVGDEGTPHLQGYLEFAKRIRAFSLKLPKQIHWEIAKAGRAKNIAYCSKDQGRQAHYSPNFKPPRPIKMLTEEQLRPWQKGLIDIANTEPDDRMLYWIWSMGGNLGKTTFCKYLTFMLQAIPLGGKAADVKNGIVTHLKETGSTPELICVPIPRSYSADCVSYCALEYAKDMYFYSGKYEGGAVCGNCPHVFVFSNFEPDYSKMSEDRWVVWQIDGPDPHGFPR